MTPAAVHHGQARAPPRPNAPRVLADAYARNPGAVRPPAAGTARAANRRPDQQVKRLTELDRLRSLARLDEPETLGDFSKSGVRQPHSVLNPGDVPSEPPLRKINAVWPPKAPVREHVANLARTACSGRRQSVLLDEPDIHRADQLPEPLDHFGLEPFHVDLYILRWARAPLVYQGVRPPSSTLIDPDPPAGTR